MGQKDFAGLQQTLSCWWDGFAVSFAFKSDNLSLNPNSRCLNNQTSWIFTFLCTTIYMLVGFTEINSIRLIQSPPLCLVVDYNENFYQTYTKYVNVTVKLH